jgi:hypothetical protein
MRDFCPKCEKDITDFLLDLELYCDKDYIIWTKCECPKCGTKLSVKLQACFLVEEDDSPVTAEVVSDKSIKEIEK